MSSHYAKHKQLNRGTEVTRPTNKSGVVQKGNILIDNEGHKYKPLTSLVIPAGKLKDAAYQRDINQAKVQKMIANYSYEQINPIKVQLREDGNYTVLDGQHTLIMLITMFGEDVKVLCNVVDILSDEFKTITDEEAGARVFAHQHDHTAKIKSTDKFKAAVIGREKYALDILKICDRNGYGVNYTNGKADTDELVCIDTLVKIYEADGTGKILDDTLDVLRGVYNGSLESEHKDFVKGIAKFIHTYENDNNYSANKFIRCLKTKVKKPKEFMDQCRSDADLSKARTGVKLSFEQTFEKNLIELYNKNLKVDNRLKLSF